MWNLCTTLSFHDMTELDWPTSCIVFLDSQMVLFPIYFEVLARIQYQYLSFIVVRLSFVLHFHSTMVASDIFQASGMSVDDHYLRSQLMFLNGSCEDLVPVPSNLFDSLVLVVSFKRLYRVRRCDTRRTECALLLMVDGSKLVGCRCR